jgi:hypothetical protein
MKKPGIAARFPVTHGTGDWHSGRGHFVGLQALLTLHNLEGDLLAFLQTLEATTGNRAEMHEYVRAIVTANETEALGVVEPLDGTDLTI